MATLDDSVLDSLRELNTLRDRAKDLRERGRKALAGIPDKLDYVKLVENCDLSKTCDSSNPEWVSGPHPIDVALLIRVLGHRDLGSAYEIHCPDKLYDALSEIVINRFIEDGNDPIPILTAARTMHALVRRPQTVFSTATMLCYYRIVRELYLAVFPNWTIGAARAGEGGRVSAFVTSECVRAILVFQRAIRDTATFFKTTKRLLVELERLEAIPNLDKYLKDLSGGRPTRWQKSLDVEFERVVLDWYAANDLRHNVIALGLTRNTIDAIEDPSPLPSLFPLSSGKPIAKAEVKKSLADLPTLLNAAINQAKTNIEKARFLIREFREKEKEALKRSEWRIAVTASSHDLALKVIDEAFGEAEIATAGMAQYEEDHDLHRVLDLAYTQYLQIYQRIHRIIEPARRYVEGVLNRELAQAANSARFDAGELLFAAACFGALTKWKQNEQLAQARRLLINQLPEDGRLQATQPFHSTSQGSRLIPIAFEMTRCFAQLLQKDFTADLDPKLVRKILNAFEENPIGLSGDKTERMGWNFRGAPESQKPSVWVTAIAVFALDRTIKMLNERINAMVLRHFNVERPHGIESAVGAVHPSPGKLDLNALMYPDYELQSLFKESKKFEEEYEEDPARVDCVSIGIRLQQMRAHLTRALLPDYYTKKSQNQKHHKTYSAILYGPPGTGKTTLAEALAATAQVPLVRLSPSDLMVQGTDVIESRARAIFDSLAMLTETVIFLDEFEPVVRTRRDLGKTRRNTPLDPPEFRFLVTGMLPKLIKLNQAAKTQSVVYCLATNYLSQIDSAAKRVGRFDLQIPIYHPDPMSRIGVFLYRLITILQQRERSGGASWQERLQELEADEKFWSLTHKVVEKTTEVSVQSLATIFFSTKGTTKSFFGYVLDDLKEELPKPTPEKSTHDQRTAVEQDVDAQRNTFEKSWTKRLHNAGTSSKKTNKGRKPPFRIDSVHPQTIDTRKRL